MKTTLLFIHLLCTLFSGVILGQDKNEVTNRQIQKELLLMSNNFKKYNKDSYLQVCYDGKNLLKKLNGNSIAINQTRFRILTYIASSYIGLGEDDSVNHYFEKANFLLKKLQINQKMDIQFWVTYWGNQGVYYREKHHFEKAIICLNKAISIQSDYYLTYLNHLGLTYDYIGDFEKAYQIYKQIEPHQFDDKYYFYSTIGINASCRKQAKLADYYFQKAQKSYRAQKKNNHEFEIQLGIQMAKCKLQNGHSDEGSIILNQTLSKAKELNLSHGKYLALCYLQKAEFLIQNNRLNEALSSIQLGIIACVNSFNDKKIAQNPNTSDKTQSPNTLIRLLSFKAQVSYQLWQAYHQTHYLSIAAKTYYLATVLAEEYRYFIDSYEDKFIYTENNADMFEKALEAIYEWNYATQKPQSLALLVNIIEATKAIALNDFMVQTLNSKNPTTNVLFKKLYVLEQQLSKVRESTNQNNKSLEQRELEFNIGLIREKISKLLPSSNLTNPFLAKEIKANLPTRSAYLSYTITPSKKLYILVIDYLGKISIKRFNSLAINVQEYVTRWLPTLNQNPSIVSYEGSKQAISLFDILIKPIESTLTDIDRLIICRDGILTYIPFDALETGRFKNDYLLNHYAISYVYSGYHHIWSNRDKNLTENQVLTFEPFTKEKTIANKGRLKALSTSRQTRARYQKVIQDSLATKKKFLSLIPNFNIINFTTHSERDSIQPNKSYLYFYPNSNEDNYKLGYYESLILPLSDKKMVVLASCKSGDGVLKSYEGLLSLGYAFTRAGSKSVVVAHWNANDISTNYINQQFWEYLRSGMPKDYALQKAKQDLLANKLFADHPSFWANLTLIGNSQALYAKSNLEIYFIIIGLSILTISVFVFAFIKFLPKKVATKL